MAEENKNKKDDAVTAQAKARAAAMAKATNTSPSQIYNETVVELKKTTWPDRETLTKSVYVVLAFIAATAVWVGSLDWGLTKVTARIFGLDH